MEIYPTIQGEGTSLGEPIILVRFNGCNLQCPWCDTKHSQKTNNIPTTVEYINSEIDLIFKEFPHIKKILFTGGEPSVKRNKDRLRDLISDIYYKHNDIKFEIETNGTNLSALGWALQLNCCDTRASKTQINISPKLDIQSFRKIHLYSEVEYLYKEQFQYFYKYLENTIKDYNIKFVFDPSDNELPNKIYKFIIMNNIPKEKIVIMSLTPSIYKYTDDEFRIKYIDNNQKTIDWCIKNGFRYSPREQINSKVK